MKWNQIFVKRVIVIAFFAMACFQLGEVIFPIAYAQADGEGGLTLSQAVDIALQTNPVLKAAVSGREIADAQLKEAWAGHLPLLQVNETYTRSNNPVFVFGSLLEQARFGPQNFQISSLNNPEAISNFRTAVTLKQPLFNQLQTQVGIARARIGQKQANLQKESVEQQLRFEVIRTYFGVLVAQAKRDVADDAVRLAEADVKRIQDRFEKGLVVESDLLAAQVQQAEFRQQQIQAMGDITIAYAALNTALNLPVNTPQRITEELVPRRFHVAGREELIDQALLNRPDYARARFAVQSKKEEVRGARGEFLPRLDLFATYGASGKDLSSSSSDYTVSTSLTFNLFDPGRVARLKQARAAESMAVAEQEHLANQIRLDVVTAYQQYLSARERLEVATYAIDQASETLRIVQNRYREGLTTITEVLRAQNALVRAHMNLIAARYEQYVSYAGILLASGRLTDIQPFTS